MYRNALAVTCIFAASMPTAAQPCEPQWSPEFSGGDMDARPRAAAIFDDGFSPALYIAGEFRRIGGFAANRIVRWDGRQWAGVAGGLTYGANAGRVSALVVFDDGAGPALFAGGLFNDAGGTPVQSIARWDGQSWAAVGNLVDADITAITVFDDGAGPSLYASWSRRVAKWDGQDWLVLGTVAGTAVHCLVAFDDGLYLGGRFQSIEGVASHNLARWDGSQWQSMGSPLFTPESTAEVRTMVVHDGDLVVAGSFSAVDGVTASRIARWDGSSWTAIPGLPSGTVRALHSSAGIGALYAAGDHPASRWDGQTWSVIGPTQVEMIAEYTDDSGDFLYIGGNFSSAGGVAAGRIARWNGQEWSRLGGSGVNNAVRILRIHDEGTGPALYAGGWFTAAGKHSALRVARWTGEAWQALGNGLGSASGSNVVYDLEMFDSGAGPQLFASTVNQISSSPLSHLARWNGESWQPIAGASTLIHALRSHDDGSGPALFAGFNTLNTLRRWNGASWTVFAQPESGVVHALQVIEDNSGPNLVAGGRFQYIGSMPVNYIARWDGQEWWQMGSPPGVWGGPFTPTVAAMTVYDAGSGPSLFIAGSFLLAGGQTVNNVARWTGSNWTPLGQGVNAQVNTIAGFDDRTSPAIYVTGNFTEASGTPANYIARWDGLSWSPLGEGLSAPGLALAAFDDGRGTGLYVGGGFDRAGGVASQYIARWGCPEPPPPHCYANCDGSTIPPILNVDDFTCYINEFASAQALPPEQQVAHYANCDNSTTMPVLNVDDFTCFINAFAAGCP